MIFIKLEQETVNLWLVFVIKYGDDQEKMSREICQSFVFEPET